MLKILIEFNIFFFACIFYSHLKLRNVSKKKMEMLREININMKNISENNKS
jgi:hypothetical protein